MTKPIKRRMFIALSISGLLAAAGAGIAVFPLSPERRLARLIRTRLSYLKISDEVLNSFIRDYMADSETRSRQRHLGTMKFVAQRAAYSQPFFLQYLPFHRFERHIIAQFLMSTDFFRKGADEDLPLTYVAYPDPYKLGCANHLAKLA